MKESGNILRSFSDTDPMPVLFLGHGSPMNAIEENQFVQGFRKVRDGIPKPNAILVISAHWETEGTRVTAMEKPRTIHDFGGFPRALFEVQYPAPGSPELAEAVKRLINGGMEMLDDMWGLDHGCWSVVKHLYPDADVPVVELSLDYNKTPEQHDEMARKLLQLRYKGVLIIGSGNMVHNLSMVAWDRLDEAGYGYEWAIKANEKMKEFILLDNHGSLIKYTEQGQEFNMAIPSPDHYLPLLYALALKKENEPMILFNDKIIGGSLSMTSVKIG